MARTKKSRTMRGKLGKTGSKEQMKEQKKALKSKGVSKFHSKKNKLRKEQAQKKLVRLGLAPEVEEAVQAPRPRRFTYVPKKTEQETPVQEKSNEESNELSVNDLMDAFTELE
ncbi:MAG: hypothetical protein ACPGUE_01620 [Marinomonas sp.]|jgi:hypothetical protein|uniref:hypothetical protein n=1 Tax=unclassified Marinomonas TaxID=196814 RepID=UPI0005FA037E|nr:MULTISPECIES: hypothetical protein [unclassified Marinomonas]KJZ12491.1 hypothetical protein TW85_15365 [Marinomonas sp. S3726]KZM39542.1 hypothetical protein OA92_19720 [Marinomonas sp. SBI22]KZM41888.1 hypothetical protein OA91_15610 [Marinomonas sp. SBI8L]